MPSIAGRPRLCCRCSPDAGAGAERASSRAQGTKACSRQGFSASLSVRVMAPGRAAATAAAGCSRSKHRSAMLIHTLHAHRLSSILNGNFPGISHYHAAWVLGQLGSYIQGTYVLFRQARVMLTCSTSSLREQQTDRSLCWLA